MPPEPARNCVRRIECYQHYRARRGEKQSTYKVIGRPVLIYAAPVWTPALNDTNWKKLKASQNSALRTITRHVKMTQQGELNRETKTILRKNHDNLLSQQFPLQSYKIEHPNNPMHQKQEPARTLKPRLKMRFDKHVTELVYLNDKKWYKRGLTRLHSRSVRSNIKEYLPNKATRGLNGRNEPTKRNETDVGTAT